MNCYLCKRTDFTVREKQPFVMPDREEMGRIAGRLSGNAYKAVRTKRREAAARREAAGSAVEQPVGRGDDTSSDADQPSLGGVVGRLAGRAAGKAAGKAASAADVAGQASANLLDALKERRTKGE